LLRADALHIPKYHNNLKTCYTIITKIWPYHCGSFFIKRK
jgi:hypothetical protein